MSLYHDRHCISHLSSATSVVRLTYQILWSLTLYRELKLVGRQGRLDLQQNLTRSSEDGRDINLHPSVVNMGESLLSTVPSLVPSTYQILLALNLYCRSKVIEWYDRLYLQQYLNPTLTNPANF